mgnify:CR=1 FL=1
MLTYRPGDTRAGNSDTLKIQPESWNLIHLLLPKSAGGEVRVTLLRPKTWLYEQRRNATGQVWLDLPELDAAGFARVSSVSPCPDIPNGPGQLVLSTFHHASAEVCDVTISGASPIGVTIRHPVWSVDREDWISARELEPGETLEAIDGTAQLVSVVSRSEAVPVYNIEVATDHTYRVGELGLLVNCSVSLSIKSLVLRSQCRTFCKKDCSNPERDSEQKE